MYTVKVLILLNRRIPNGTYGGVRGEISINDISPTRLTNELTICLLLLKLYLLKNNKKILTNMK